MLIPITVITFHPTALSEQEAQLAFELSIWRALADKSWFFGLLALLSAKLTLPWASLLGEEEERPRPEGSQWAQPNRQGLRADSRFPSESRPSLGRNEGKDRAAAESTLLGRGFQGKPEGAGSPRSVQGLTWSRREVVWAPTASLTAGA